MFRQTRPMNCWFYAAKTIVYQRTGQSLVEADQMGMTPPLPYPVETGRGAGVPSWLQFGLSPHHVRDFANLFGFAEPPFRPATWTSSDLERILRQCGPLWFGGHGGQFSHVVVVNGIDAASNVSYGDPATGHVHTASLADFNGWKRQMPGLPNPLCYVGR
jgi:hypothetical protein